MVTKTKWQNNLTDTQKGSIAFLRVWPKMRTRVLTDCWGGPEPPPRRWADNEIWAEELGLKERSSQDKRLLDGRYLMFNPHDNKKGDLRGKND